MLDFSTLYELPKQIERIFDEFFEPLDISQRRIAYPPVNVVEDKDNIYVYVELPGVNPEDVELDISENSLIIKGERKVEEGKYFRQERPTGTFQRIINFNVKVEKDKAKASMKNGLLTIIIPKKEEVKSRQIPIET